MSNISNEGMADTLGKVLFLAPQFYNYHQRISEAISKKGYDVSGFEISFMAPSTWPKSHKILHRLGFKKYTSAIHRRDFETKLDKAPKDNDYVIIINAAYLNDNDMQKLRKDNPNAKFVLHMWDSLQKISQVKALWKYFDKIYSFEPNDCRQYEQLIFRPNFYTLPKEKTSSEPKWFLSFIGGDRPGRYEALLQMKMMSEGKSALPSYLRLKTSILKMLKDRVTGNKICFNRQIPYSKYLQIIGDSQCVVDIQETTGQAGLTMRTLDLLAQGKHLFTTNPSIADYPYINPGSYTIIDKDSPELVAKASVEPSEEFKQYYSIDAFVSEWFN